MAETRLSHHLHGSVALVVSAVLSLMPTLAQAATAALPVLVPAAAVAPSHVTHAAGRPGSTGIDAHALGGHRNFGAAGVAGASVTPRVGRGGFGSLLRGEAASRAPVTVRRGEALDVSGDGFLRIAVQHVKVPRGQTEAYAGGVTLDATALHEAARAVVNTTGSTEASSASGRSGAIFLGGKPGTTHE